MRRHTAHLPTRRRRSGGGFTLIEVMVGGAISFVVMAAVLALFHMTAVTIHESVPRGLKNGVERRIMDSVRYRLMHAAAGSQVILDEGRRIEFNDPNRGEGVLSAFWFEGGLLHYDDILGDDSDGMVVARGADEVTFEAGDVPVIVRLRVILSVPLGRGKIERREGSTVVYLRNGQV